MGSIWAGGFSTHRADATLPINSLKNCHTTMKTILSRRFALCASALVSALFTMNSAQAIGGTEPLVDILNAPGSAGLGFVTRIETSPYAGGGTRYDLLPVYLYEGDRLFLHANRAGIKLINEGD
eukprot:gene13513-16524_t